MNTLVIFATVPDPGMVKTRLAETSSLSPEQACLIYEAFLKDLFAVCALTSAETIAVHYTPAEGEKKMRQIMRSQNLGARNERRFIFAAQTGETLTERIVNSFNEAKKFGGDSVVMINADAPVLKPEIINAAFDFISARSGLALGPSSDGGVYLIGIPREMEPDFTNVFTEGSEIENLVAIAKGGNVPLKLLPEILEVNSEPELVTLIGVMRALSYQRKFESQVFPMNTFKAIEDMGLRVYRQDGGSPMKKIAVEPAMAPETN